MERGICDATPKPDRIFGKDRTRTRGSPPSWPERMLRAGYISADLLETNLHEIHLQTGGGPYIRYTQPLAAWLEVDAHAENVVAQMTGHLGPRYRRGIVEGLHVKIFRPQGDIGGDEPFHASTADKSDPLHRY